jgi:hypothetical protein
MSTALQTTSLQGLDEATMLALVAGGDCSRLTPAQRTAYYVARCEAAGLDPRAQPFQFVRLQGGEKLYATKAATDQLAGKHGIVCTIVSQATDSGVRVVTVRATSKDGKSQEDVGIVPVEGLKGEALANAMMKAVTKAKRRTILSLCGLGMLDESEVETIPGAQPVEAHEPPKARAVEVVPPPPPEPPKPETPKHVLALWSRLLAEVEGDKTKCAAELGKAVTKVWGAEPPPKHAWTPEDCDVLFKAATDVEWA